MHVRRRRAARLRRGALGAGWAVLSLLAAARASTAFPLAGVAQEPTTDDPLFVTYFGGERQETVHDVAHGPDGDLYIAGETASRDLPPPGFRLRPTSGASRVDSAQPLDVDAFVARIDGATRKVRWVSYLGGALQDAALAIVVAPDGGSVIVGGTFSADLPMLKAHQARHAGRSDAFVARLTPDGRQLEHATYLGGTDSDLLVDAALDSDGTLFAVGWTRSPDFPQLGGVQPGFGDDRPCERLGESGAVRPCGDALLVAVAPDGRVLRAASFGGAREDRAMGVWPDGTGRAWIAGFTRSPDLDRRFAVTRPFDGAECELLIVGELLREPCADAFVALWEPTGSRIERVAHVGGSADDRGAALAVDAHGIVLAGSTASPDFPVVEAFQPSRGGGSCQNGRRWIDCPDGFIARLEADMQRLVFGTYLGGAEYDDVYDLATAPDGATVVVGETYAPDFRTTTGRRVHASPWASDAFLVTVDRRGRLLRSDVLGGSSFDVALAVSAHADEIAVVGETTSVDLPVLRPIQATKPGGLETDGFVAVVPPVAPNAFRIALPILSGAIGR